MAEHSAQHKAEDHSNHLMLLGAAGLASATVLAPYALPFLNIGDSHTTHRIMSFIGGESVPGFYGTGIAGSLQEAISNLPLVGEALTSTASVTIPGIGLTLASGALTTIIASAVIGIGGMLLANWMEKNELPSDKIHWSKIIRTVSLSTSILISLPSILTGISVGLTFLANLFDTQLGNKVAFAMSSDYGLGATSMPLNNLAGSSPLSSLVAILPHLVTCGGAIIPVMLTLLSGKKPTATKTQEATTNETASTFSIKPLPHAPVSKGQPCELAFQLIDDATGRALGDDELATIHTKKIHTMIVDASLSDYHHVHPTYDSARKLFTCQFTPTRQANYAMWNDFKVLGEQPTQVKSELCATRAFSIPARIDSAREVVADGLRIRITPDAPLRAGQNTMLRIDVCDASTGKPVDNLEPIMGAFAHLAGFSADGNHFTHIHPLGDEPQTDTARGTGHLNFHITPDIAGGTKFFLQIQRAGQIITVPFGAMVAPALGFTQKLAAPTASHSHHAMA